MIENLSQMIKESSTEETLFSEEDLSKDENKSMDETRTIDVVSLTNWFDKYVDKFLNLKKPTVSIQGVDPEEQLIVTTVVPNSGEIEKRKLIVFDNANEIPILNLEPMDMQIYRNGFRTVYNYLDNIYIKSYGIRTGLMSVFCEDVNDMLIPRKIMRTKKHDNILTINLNDLKTNILEKLKEPVDLEALQLRYKQSSKATDLHTNKDAIQWLIERQGDIEDVHHHIQIDNVVIETLM